MEGNNLPLALNPWMEPSAPNSFKAANDAVDKIFNPEQDEFLGEHPALTQFIKDALYAKIMDQSRANYEQYQLVEPYLRDGHEDYTKGTKDPADLLLFLHATPALNSIEIARRTEKKWNYYHAVDAPVRYGLDHHFMLYTDTVKSDLLYRIKNLNPIGGADHNYVLVDRKRTVRQHFGGEVLTIVRNSFVLHDDGSDRLPRDLRKLIHEQREAARRVRDYDYDQHFDELEDHIEPHFINRMTKERPDWMLPLMTTYYGAKRSAIRTKQLLQIEDVDFREIT